MSWNVLISKRLSLGIVVSERFLKFNLIVTGFSQRPCWSSCPNGHAYQVWSKLAQNIQRRCTERAPNERADEGGIVKLTSSYGSCELEIILPLPLYILEILDIKVMIMSWDIYYIGSTWLFDRALTCGFRLGSVGIIPGSFNKCWKYPPPWDATALKIQS